MRKVKMWGLKYPMSFSPKGVLVDILLDRTSKSSGVLDTIHGAYYGPFGSALEKCSWKNANTFR